MTDRAGSTGRPLLLAAAWIALVVTGVIASRLVTTRLAVDIQLTPETDAMWRGIVLSAVATYVLLMALPFVPGVEIGVTLLVLFGRELALLIYLGTVLSLALSFLAGRLVPERLLVGACERAGLRRTHALLQRLESRSPDQRLRLLLGASPLRSVTLLLRFRLLALAILLNLPGNVLVGGAGGIGMATGMSRLVRFPAYLATVALATAPVPLMVALTDRLPFW